jgi:predicted alpha/beta superfamily hydrolase
MTRFIACTCVILAALLLALSTTHAQKKKSNGKANGKASLPPAADTVRFVIDMRKMMRSQLFNPKEDTIGVRGGIPPLDWNVTIKAQDKEGTGLYGATVIFKRRNASKTVGQIATYQDQRIPYKFKIESSITKPNEGWEQGDNSALVLTGTGSQTVQRAFGEVARDPLKHSLTGNIKVHEAFPSKNLPPRDVIVYLPPNYDKEPSARYPVLYMHDGQNIFDDATASGSEWHLDEIAEALIRAGVIKPVIIVGIYNMPDVGRINEYTPSSIIRAMGAGRSMAVGGKSDAFAKLLIEEVKPFIDKTYRTLPDAANTALGGSSLGGLSSLWIGAKHTNVFGSILAVSPSLWWDNKLMVNEVKTWTEKRPLRIWLDMGVREGAEYMEDVRLLKQYLVSIGWKEGAELRYVEALEGRHDEASWAARAEPMLRFLFSAK